MPKSVETSELLIFAEHISSESWTVPQEKLLSRELLKK